MRFKSFPRSFEFLPRSPAGDRCHSLFQFISRHKRWPNEKSNRLNDRLFFLKTSDRFRDPLRGFITDKEYAKIFLRSRIPEKYVIPTLGVIRARTEVKHYEFPNRCAIKATHGWNQTVLRKHGEALELQAIERWWEYNHYNVTREFNYRHLTPKIIIEPLVFDSDDVDDYKVFCVDGVPRAIEVIRGRRRDISKSFYTADWQKIPVVSLGTREEHITQPPALSTMLELASALSRGFDWLRVDMFCEGANVYVGELTSIHANASARFVSQEMEDILSKVLFS